MTGSLSKLAKRQKKVSQKWDFPRVIRNERNRASKSRLVYFPGVSKLSCQRLFCCLKFFFFLFLTTCYPQLLQQEVLGVGWKRSRSRSLPPPPLPPVVWTLSKDIASCFSLFMSLSEFIFLNYNLCFCFESTEDLTLQ